MTSIRSAYIALNKSFKKKMVFHLGADAGFFSEYNNMILAMLYCLEHKIQFVLYSDKANFRIEKGWEDFFQPFCDEDRDSFHAQYNWRYPPQPHIVSFLDRLKIKFLKKIKGVDFFTYELWNEFHNREMENRTYDIPELKIKGDLRSACRQLVSITWNYNPEIAKKIQDITKDIGLSKPYVGLHIRQGDKGIEYDVINTRQYIEKAEENVDLRTAFVLTDDYAVIDELHKEYKQWDIYTLCTKTEKGYIHTQFQQEASMDRKSRYVNLFASVDFLVNSELFVGTYSSNIGMFVGMLLDENKCKCIDLEHWQIW